MLLRCFFVLSCCFFLLLFLDLIWPDLPFYPHLTLCCCCSLFVLVHHHMYYFQRKKGTNNQTNKQVNVVISRGKKKALEAYLIKIIVSLLNPLPQPLNQDIIEFDFKDLCDMRCDKWRGQGMYHHDDAVVFLLGVLCWSTTTTITPPLYYRYSILFYFSFFLGFWERCGTVAHTI